jgi:hypothetical protein
MPILSEKPPAGSAELPSSLLFAVMETTASRELLAELFEEYSEWYRGLAREYGSLPRSVSGVSATGLQFICLLDDLSLHHMARNKYVRFVLDDMRSVAYVYGSIDLDGDSDIAEIVEVLDIVAADAGHYMMGRWRVLRDKDGKIAGLSHLETRAGNDPEKQPGSWFLVGSISFSEAEKHRYGALWKAAKPSVIFRERSGGD